MGDILKVLSNEKKSETIETNNADQLLQKYKDRLSKDIGLIIEKLPDEMKKQVEKIEQDYASNQKNPTIKVISFLKENNKITHFHYVRELNKVKREMHEENIGKLNKNGEISGIDPRSKILEYKRKHKLISEDEYVTKMGKHIKKTIKDKSLVKKSIEELVKRQSEDKTLQNANSNKSMDINDKSNMLDMTTRSNKLYNLLESAKSFMKEIERKSEKDSELNSKSGEDVKKSLISFREKLVTILKVINNTQLEIRKLPLNITQKNQLLKDHQKTVGIFRDIREMFGKLSKKHFQTETKKQETDIFPNLVRPQQKKQIEKSG